MCLNALFLLFPYREFCLLVAFDAIRSFVLTGFPVDNAFVKQWTSPSNPIVEMLGLDYNVNIGLFQHAGKLFGIVYFPAIGIFVVNIGPLPSMPFDRIMSGLQPMDDDLCLFFSAITGKDSFLVADRKIALETRRRLTVDALFQ
jgi:hypothetical protein